MKRYFWMGLALALTALKLEAAPGLPSRDDAVIIGREDALERAFSEGDLGQIDNILARDFEIRYASHPGRVSARRAWLNALDVNDFPGKVTERTVFSDGVSAWVSYLWTPKRGGPPLWIMDHWDGVDENAHLLTRFYATTKAVKSGKKD